MKKFCFAAFAVFATLVSFAQIRVHSHRGETDFAPQNTVEAIKLAYDMGSEMIETDFWLTKEGTFVCVHTQKELKQFWGIDKSPELLTNEEIKNARLVNPSAYDKKYANCKLPTLKDVLAVIPKNRRFELEIKHYGKDFADKVEAARIEAGLDYWNILITCFDPAVIRDFKQKYPKYKTQLIISYNPKTDTINNLVRRAKHAEASEIAIGNYRKIDAAYVKRLHDEDFKVGFWQVENLDDLAYAAKMGADRVCSNHAYRLRENFKLIKSLDFK